MFLSRNSIFLGSEWGSLPSCHWTMALTVEVGLSGSTSVWRSDLEVGAVETVEVGPEVCLLSGTQRRSYNAISDKRYRRIVRCGDIDTGVGCVVDGLGLGFSR
jgi:hypothetical protein